MEKFGLIGRLIAVPGKRDELAALLLDAAAAAESFDGCELYAVHVADDDPDGVWVTEVWRDAAAHQASLQLESTKAMIARGRALIAGFGESRKLRTLGGKGLS
ncbi:antibiotic biosynthesis monooxygenase [Paenibacillus antri]|uniref:Antibiotic biosynthesis monooxygenase n=1 Tax=Paenibacillus antri TaxID=2582848 RepID=A0A5R9G9E2_9BACL|nr:antibiotic biosynthesis monooxygenase [Paenibacillus antri]TLS50710.1 antibiotic biosynthesis monooxygenase [Paenibacillus antri]